jgi:hypothetical protein
MFYLEKTTNVVILIFFATALPMCGLQKSLERAMNAMESDVSDAPASKVLGRAGELTVDDANFYYANAAYDASSPEELSALSEGARRLVIQKILLRRLAVQKAFEEDLLSDPEAARYLWPRMEKLIEEYYYYKTGNFQQIEREVARMRPDDATLAEFMTENAAVRSAGASEAQVRAEQERILRRVQLQKMSEAREKAVRALLDSSPRLEVTP